MTLPSYGQVITRDGEQFGSPVVQGDDGGGGGAPSGPAGGELAGTYPNPTVAASHSGSTHAAVQAAAEAAAAAAAAALYQPLVPRVGTVASSATPTPTASLDLFTVTALGEAATFAAPTGSPVNGQKLTIRIKDNGTARALGWNAIYRAGTDVALPTTTVINKTLYAAFLYNSADTKWDLVATADGF